MLAFRPAWFETHASGDRFPTFRPLWFETYAPGDVESPHSLSKSVAARSGVDHDGLMGLELTVPIAATAMRPSWAELPQAVRERIDALLGSPVRSAVSQGSGFTPGFASRLVLEDGRRCFVKAADDRNPWLQEAYANEAAKLALIPTAVPAPRLQTTMSAEIDGRSWLVLVFEDIDGEPPTRPWTLIQARRSLATVAALSRELTPPPGSAEWPSLQQELAPMAADAIVVARTAPWASHIDELTALVARQQDLLAGHTLVHFDVRDDNLIIDRSGAVWLCDWNFPAVGPLWTDAVSLAISMSGDGLDAEALLAEALPATLEERAGVDCLLALLTGYFTLAATRPANPTSPYLRAHQDWYARAAGGWLRARRGWT
jgi:Ser/Thr protein kinase RdoA (MazF antagonist)